MSDLARALHWVGIANDALHWAVAMQQRAAVDHQVKTAKDALDRALKALDDGLSVR